MTSLSSPGASTLFSELWPGSWSTQLTGEEGSTQDVSPLSPALLGILRVTITFDPEDGPVRPSVGSSRLLLGTSKSLARVPTLVSGRLGSAPPDPRFPPGHQALRLAPGRGRGRGSGGDPSGSVL